LNQSNRNAAILAVSQMAMMPMAIATIVLLIAASRYRAAAIAG
jgi:hypothetical protein